MYSSRECRVDMASGPVSLIAADHMPKEKKMTCPIGTASFDSFLLPLHLPPLL